MTTQAPVAPPQSATGVLEFWFGAEPDNAEDIGRCTARWFGGAGELDEAIRVRFGATIAAAASGSLDEWAQRPRSCLALIILLDQFPRNVHRGHAAAFRYDSRARGFAKRGIAAALDRTLAPLERVFFYLPLAHSESRADQAQSVELFETLAALDVEPFLRKSLADSAAFARQHRDIIARFGRFPHRNIVLGRKSTAEETRFLGDGGPRFGQPAAPQA